VKLEFDLLVPRVAPADWREAAAVARRHGQERVTGTGEHLDLGVARARPAVLVGQLEYELVLRSAAAAGIAAVEKEQVPDGRIVCKNQAVRPTSVIGARWRAGADPFVTACPVDAAI